MLDFLTELVNHLLKEAIQQPIIIITGNELGLDTYESFSLEDFVKSGVAWKTQKKYLDGHARPLDRGKDRLVYEIGPELILKFMSSLAYGREQNKAEYQAYRCAVHSSVASIYAVSNNFSWLIVEKVEPYKSTESFEKDLGKLTNGLITNSHDFRAGIRLGLTILDTDPREIFLDKFTEERARTHNKLFKENSWYRNLVLTVKSCRLNVSELVAPNFGRSRLDGTNRIVILDYGDRH